MARDRGVLRCREPRGADRLPAFCVPSPSTTAAGALYSTLTGVEMAAPLPLLRHTDPDRAYSGRSMSSWA